MLQNNILLPPLIINNACTFFNWFLTMHMPRFSRVVEAEGLG